MGDDRQMQLVRGQEIWVAERRAIFSGFNRDGTGLVRFLGDGKRRVVRLDKIQLQPPGRTESPNSRSHDSVQYTNGSRSSVMSTRISPSASSWTAHSGTGSWLARACLEFESLTVVAPEVILRP